MVERKTVQSKPESVRRHLLDLLDGLGDSVDMALPSERQLAAELGVARMTLRKAIDALVEEGRVVRIVGKGTFALPEKTALEPKLTGYSEEMRRRGMEPDSELLAFDQVPAPMALAREMGLGAGAPLVRYKRLMLADGAPMTVDENFIPLRLVPGILQGPAPTSLYRILSEDYGLHMDWGEDTITASAATATLSRQLRVELGAPLLRVQRRAYVRESLVDYSVSYYRADRYSISVPLRRPGQRRYSPRVTQSPLGPR
ncbi:GntR family transcriptional regulator [Falsarthrobacter nasiphocae]|uniref:GntR family transcriptional regulator n=1 Tax=Falsarthrobacter nasiphocae TaxID=189863 RepID=A0AAE3YFQ3_9MICC|nr:GntR family transcriptional regulator [Falsarthrobacter nasiphocae]MDR6891088.1 GntR family transcriptional regulator [Falsarthrobacter nasiphocae]